MTSSEETILYKKQFVTKILLRVKSDKISNLNLCASTNLEETKQSNSIVLLNIYIQKYSNFEVASYFFL